MADIEELRDYFISNYGESQTNFVTELDELIQAATQAKLQKAFRDGQLDCQKAGDPTNHGFFKEAIQKAVTEARIDELEHVLDGGEGVSLNFDPEINPITREERIADLKTNGKGGDGG